MDCVFDDHLIFLNVSEPLQSVDQVLRELRLDQVFDALLVEIGDVSNKCQHIPQEFLGSE